MAKEKQSGLRGIDFAAVMNIVQKGKPGIAEYIEKAINQYPNGLILVHKDDSGTTVIETDPESATVEGTKITVTCTKETPIKEAILNIL